MRDDASFFSPDAVQKADTAIQQMQRGLGKEMLVETYPAIPAERASEYRPENKDDFFRKWGNERATAAHVSGVYILINRTPSYLFITAGNKTRERDFTTTDENQLRDQMLTLLKQKQYDAALAKAVEFVPQRIRENRQQTGGAATANRAPPPPPDGYNVPPTRLSRDSAALERFLPIDVLDRGNARTLKVILRDKIIAAYKNHSEKSMRKQIRKKKRSRFA